MLQVNEQIEFHTLSNSVTEEELRMGTEVNGVIMDRSSLSGIEELTILFCSFLTLVANKRFNRRFGAGLSHRLNSVRTDDTTQDSEETATAFTASHNLRTKF